MSSSVALDIENLARPIVEAKKSFIVDVRIRGERGGKVVELFIDADSGVTTGLCAEISRELSHALDLADVIHGRFHLVVSSPGIDRPLKYPRQYAQHIGRTLNVTDTVDGVARQTEGELVRVLDDGIELRLKDGSVVHHLFQMMKEARVQSAW